MRGANNNNGNNNSNNVSESQENPERKEEQFAEKKRADGKCIKYIESKYRIIQD